MGLRWGRSHAPALVTAFHPRINDWETEFVKMRRSHSLGDENPKFDSRTALGRHTLTSLTSLWPTTRDQQTPKAEREESNLRKLRDRCFEAVNRGRDMVQGAEYARGSDLGRLAQRLQLPHFWDQYPSTGQAGPATFCHWIYSVQQLNTFQ